MAEDIQLLNGKHHTVSHLNVTMQWKLCQIYQGILTFGTDSLAPTHCSSS